MIKETDLERALKQQPLDVSLDSDNALVCWRCHEVIRGSEKKFIIGYGRFIYAYHEGCARGRFGW
jgi:hypothetical protein